MMNETPPRAGACCLLNANELTHRKISPKGNITGMQNLEVISQQLYLLGR